MAIPQAEEAWTEHGNSLTTGSLFTEGNSWFMGTNIPGKKPTFLLYAGGSSDHIYDLLDSDLNLKRAITIHDFAKDLQHWAH